MKELQKKLDYKFNDEAYLKRALTHVSYVNEKEDTSKSYERLEFLGDSILDFVLSEALLKRYPEWTEGMLTQMRANLVRADNLAEKSRSLKLGKHILLGKGEDQSGGREKISILSDVMESLIGAIYLDSSTMSEVRNFIEKLFSKDLKGVDRKEIFSEDYKSRLQNIIQKKGANVPGYELLEDRGPGHKKEFKVVISLGNTEFQGKGRSKQKAQQEAARKALKRKESWINEIS